MVISYRCLRGARFYSACHFCQHAVFYLHRRTVPGTRWLFLALLPARRCLIPVRLLWRVDAAILLSFSRLHWFCRTTVLWFSRCCMCKLLLPYSPGFSTTLWLDVILLSAAFGFAELRYFVTMFRACFCLPLRHLPHCGIMLPFSLRFVSSSFFLLHCWKFPWCAEFPGDCTHNVETYYLAIPVGEPSTWALAVNRTFCHSAHVGCCRAVWVGSWFGSVMG
jgi:hypothetical protein